MINSNMNAIEPPIAPKKPTRLERHGHARIDDYYWLRERGNSEVLDYIGKENEYAESFMKDAEELRKKLFLEMKSRIKEDDATVPFKWGDYYYYARYETGKEYPVYARKKGGLESEEEIIADVNDLSEGKTFCHVLFPKPSPGGKFVAYAADFRGRRFYAIFVKNMETGRVVEKIENTAGNFSWAGDGETYFYVRQNPETLRWEKVYRRKVGEPPGKEEEVYFEKDETYDVSVWKSKTGKYVFLRSGSTLSTEYRYLEAGEPSGEFKVFCPRRKKLEYEIDDAGNGFYILNNGDARNFKLSFAPYGDTDKEAWKEIIPHREDVLLEYFDVFRDRLVLKERKDGLGRLRVLKRPSLEGSEIKFEEPVYMCDLGDNMEYETKILRLTYESMTTPPSVYDYDMEKKTKTLMKREEVLGGFRPENYKSERVWAEARDGTKIPVSLVYNKSLFKKGKNPLHLYAYGSYGASMDPYFSSTRLSLLDRGFVCAIAHVRGGSELGRKWYEDGKLLKKKNTFADFIDSAGHLLEEKYAAPGHVYAEGGSAGGLLMGAVANMAPSELFKGIIAEVPFVDVVTTMLDDSVPLTTAEYDEWGDPNEKKYYDYMLSYSPYDNVRKKTIPTCS